MTISVCNEKGGCGKTTIAVNLAVKLGVLKDDVILIDADPQMSINVFNEIRSRKELPLIFNCVSKFGAGLAREINSLKSKYDTIVIDTGGRDSEEMRQALVVSDLVIIPVSPSDLDIAVLNKMIKLFDLSKALNPQAKALIVISRASPNPFLTQKIKDLQEYIKDKNLNDIFLLNAVLFEREAHKNAITNGKGIVEFQNSNEKACKDFDNFFEEVVKYGNK